MATPLTCAKFADGAIGVGLLALTLPLGCALIWLNVRQARWPVFAYPGLSALGAITAIFSNDPTLALVLLVALGAYKSFQFAVWNGACSPAPPVA